jgi:hypothetical protein
MFRAEHRNPGNGHNLRKIRSFHSTLRGTQIAGTRSMAEIECLRVFLMELKCRFRRLFLGVSAYRRELSSASKLNSNERTVQ